MPFNSKDDDLENSRLARLDKKIWLPVNKTAPKKQQDQETAELRKAVTQALYRIPEGDPRRKLIRRHEMLVILDMGDSTFGRLLKGEALATIHGDKVAVTKPKMGKLSDKKSTQCYDLNNLDNWLKEHARAIYDEIHAIVDGTPAKPPTVSEIKTLSQSDTTRLLAMLNQNGEIMRILANHDETLREILAGHTFGFVTLTEAMTKYTWSSNQQRERARRVWLHILDSEQKQIVNYRELDRERAAQTEQVVLKHVLPKRRHSGRGSHRLTDQRL